MKITLLCVGKLSIPFLKEGADDYEQRLKRFISLQIVELKEEKRGGKKADVQFVRNSEADQLLARIPDGAYTIALDERGKQCSSEKFAEKIERHMTHGTNQLCLVIGGAYGLSDALKQHCNERLSLSEMTLTHQMARLLLLEQLYRGMTIIRNEPYHNR